MMQSEAATPEQSSSSSGQRPPLARDPSSQNNVKPKGILKNAPTENAAAVATNAEGVRWDEVNLNLNEVNRDSTMKITEPKTPYVRYNPETDEVMDLDKIPGLALGQTDRAAEEEDEEDGDAPGPSITTPASATTGKPSTSSTLASGESGSATTTTATGSSSRSSSFSGSRRGSETSRRSSDVSERKMVVVEDHGPGVDAEDEGADEETRQARREFKQRRGSHYSGEGEIMKRFRAGKLDIEDDDEDDEKEESAIVIDEEENGGGLNGSKIPPVPKLPNGTS